MTSTEDPVAPNDAEPTPIGPDAGPNDAEPTPVGPDAVRPTVRPVRPAPLVRSRHDRWIAGVCGGLAAHLGVDVTLLRILMVVLAVVGNLITVALYLACWVVVPDGPAPADRPDQAFMSTPSIDSE